MGIKRFNTFYKELLDSSRNNLKSNLRTDNKNIIVIDCLSLLYKKIIGKINNNSSEKIHIVELFNASLNFLQMKLIPIYVFDGKPPQEKNCVTEQRKNVKLKASDKCNDIYDTDSLEFVKCKKKAFHLTISDIDECKELLQLMGIPYVESKEESGFKR